MIVDATSPVLVLRKFTRVSDRARQGYYADEWLGTLRALWDKHETIVVLYHELAASLTRALHEPSTSLPRACHEPSTSLSRAFLESSSKLSLEAALEAALLTGACCGVHSQAEASTASS